jgi:hypothetical protein
MTHVEFTKTFLDGQSFLVSDLFGVISKLDQKWSSFFNSQKGSELHARTGGQSVCAYSHTR